MDLHPVYYVLIPFFGLFVGSFFNVAIHRWPKEDAREREWVRTRSNCPKCHTLIHWYDNIPLVSYIMLQGKCRSCKEPISLRYPAVELGTALLWLGTTWLVTTYGLTGHPPEAMTLWHIVFAIIFASLCLLTVIIDFETGLIPFEISIPFFICAWLFLFICGPVTISDGIVDSLIGMAVLSTFFLILYFCHAMGMGDVELALGMGVLFGWKLVLTAGFAGFLMGGVVATGLLIALKVKKQYKKRNPMPFGPYLAIGTFICIFFGQELMNWYLSLYKI